MAKLLVVARGMPSITYPNVELARRLAADGHSVTFAGEPATRALAERHGLSFLELEANRYREFMSEDGSEAALHRLLRLRERRQSACESTGTSSFVEAVAARSPDLLLIDGEMHEHIITASALGVPTVLTNSFASIWRRPGLPPSHHRARPGAGWRGSRAGMRLLWWSLRLAKRRKALSRRLRHWGCDRESVLTALARQAGFDLPAEVDRSQWLIPFSYRRLPYLSLHALELEFPHRPPERVRYVGPLLLEDRVDRPLPAADRARIDAILERRRSRKERHLIYAAFGSAFSAAPDLPGRLAAAVAARPDWELVMSLPGEQAAELPAEGVGVHSFEWLPQLDVLDYADAAVTHGGINTIDECVLASVPMLVYCGGETDMAGNTERVVFHGLGLAGDGRRDGPAQIGAHLDRLLTATPFRENLARMRRHFEAYREERVAETAVRDLLASHGTRREGR